MLESVPEGRYLVCTTYGIMYLLAIHSDLLLSTENAGATERLVAVLLANEIRGMIMTKLAELLFSPAMHTKRQSSFMFTISLQPHT